MMHKKAQAEWVSWVLLVGMTLIIAVLIGRYYMETAKSTSTTVKTFLQDQQVCDSVGLSALSSCQLPQALNIELSNTRTVNIDKVVFRLYNAGYESQSITVGELIEPGRTKNLTVGKSGMSKKIDVIPLVETEDAIVICSSKQITLESVADC